MAKIHNLLLRYKNERDFIRKQPESELNKSRLLMVTGAIEALRLLEDKKK